MPFPPGLVNSYTLVEGYTLADLTRWLLLGAVVVLLSLVAVRISARSGLPTMLLYLGIGLAFGDGGAGIAFDNAALTQVLGYAALILILAEGGLTTPWNGIRKAVFPAIVLSTVGVFVSIGVVAVACHLLLGLTWPMALLMGAILSSTDAAAVFSVLRDVPLPSRLRGILEAESGFNDAPVVIITTAFALQLTEGDAPDPAWQLALLALVELGVGAVIGIAVGWLGGKAVRLLARGASGIFAIGVIAVPVLGYAVAASVHASGFIAAYLAALVLGNMRLPHRAAVNGFVQALGTIAQVGLFFLLGLLASPSRLPVEAWPALVIGLVLLVVARPLSVAASLTPFRVPWRDQLFVSWAGLRGAVPVVLATVPATLGATGTRWIFDFVFVLVLIYTLVQGPSLPWVARKLGVVESVTQVPLSVETTALDRMDAEVVMATIGPDSKLAGVEIFELRLPAGANVTLVLREDGSFVPEPVTRLRTGDELLIVTPSAAVDAVHERLVAVSRAGRLAGWVPDPHEPLSRTDRAKAKAKRIARKAGSVLPPSPS